MIEKERNNWKNSVVRLSLRHGGLLDDFALLDHVWKYEECGHIGQHGDDEIQPEEEAILIPSKANEHKRCNTIIHIIQTAVQFNFILTRTSAARHHS